MDVGIIVCTIVVGAFIFSVAGRLSYTKAEKEAFAPRVLQTQILNGCGESGLAAEFAELLMQSPIGEYRFDIIDRDNYSRFDVEQSFLISYTLTREDADQLGAAVGFAPDQVFIADNTDNPWGLDISIVLGRSDRPVVPSEGSQTPAVGHSQP